MDNLEDKTKHDTNSSGEYQPLRPDPIRQARDDTGRPNKGLQPGEIVHSANRPISVADSRLLSNQFIGRRESAQDVQSGNDIIKSMLRFKWMILAIFILVAAPMITIIWTQVVPEYQAGAEVRVRPIIPYLVFRTEDSGMIPLYSSFLNTQVSLMKGSTVLQRALDHEEVQQTQWYKEPSKTLVQRLLGNPPASHIERLRDGLSIKPRKETEIIDVAFIDSRTSDAKIILDAILDEYIIYVGEKSDATKDELYNQLLEQYKTLETDIKGQEMISAELKRNLGTGTPQELISSKRVRLDGMQARFIELQQNIAVLEFERKELYVKYIEEMSNAVRDKLHSQLVDQCESLETEILELEKTSAELPSTSTGTSQELDSGVSVRRDETQARLSELRQSIAVTKWKRKKLEDLMKQAVANDSNDVSVDSTVTMERQPKYHEDAEWRALDVNVRTIRHKIATSLLTTRHPGAAQVKKDLEFAEELLRRREMQLDEEWRDGMKNASDVPVATTGASGPDYEEELRILERQLARMKYEEQLLSPEFDKQQTEFQELFNSAQLLEQENNALKHKRELFSAVRQRLEEERMERNVPGSIEVLTKASVSSKPYNDRRIVLTATALFLGLGIGGGLAFLRAGRNQTIYAPKDMPHPMQVPFLGYIPVTRTRRSSGDEVDPAMIESIRFVRTALLSRLDSQDSTSVLVTSADIGTGKSTFTMMLGKSLAQTGKKVLMIDADFRKMTLTRRLNLTGKSGFLESLYCRSVDKRHIFPTETFGLSFMPAGKRGSSGIVYEETANGAFNTCIGQLRQQYNIILLDSSPILPVADATILSSQVDGTIMVERELVSRRENVIDALARLGSAGGRLLGTVFVGSSSQEGYKYNYHYGKTSES